MKIKALPLKRLFCLTLLLTQSANAFAVSAASAWLMRSEVGPLDERPPTSDPISLTTVYFPLLNNFPGLSNVKATLGFGSPPFDREAIQAVLRIEFGAPRPQVLSWSSVIAATGSQRLW